MKRRKHRLVVEVTFDEPVTAKQAAWALKRRFDPELEYGADQVVRTLGINVTSGRVTNVKEFDRVVEGLRRTGQLELPL